MNLFQLDATVDTHPINSSSQRESNTSSTSSTSSDHDTDCGCCATTVRSVHNLKNMIDSLSCKVSQIHARLPNAAAPPDTTPDTSPQRQRANDNNENNITRDDISLHDISITNGSGRHVPGNSSYADMSRVGKKVAILSDSMCGRIRIPVLNKVLENKRAYRKLFPGSTPDDILHYCTRTLSRDKPDIAIIHVGTNKVKEDDPFEIAGSIAKIVETCKHYGTNSVFVSGVVYRPDAVESVNQLNTILYQWSFLHGYTFICNDNIKYDCLDRDELHLNFRGSNRLTSNFRRALNKPYV